MCEKLENLARIIVEVKIWQGGVKFIQYVVQLFFHAKVHGFGEICCAL
jgi:hypothetical protein